MRIRLAMLALLMVLSAGVGLPAHATALYDNGPVNGNINAWDITTYAVADSFNLAASSTVKGVTFYTWNLSGDVPSTVDWSITTLPFAGTTLASGTDNLASTLLFTNGSGYDIYSNQFSVASLGLGAGAYWLQLQNATNTAGNGNPLYWDENDGPSQAWSDAYGPGPIDPDTTLGACASPGASGNCSHAFQITGDASAVPEPGSLTLLATGLVGLAGVLRRRPSR